MKDVLIITADTMCMMDVLREGLTSHTEMTFDFLDYHAIKTNFRYRSFGERTVNFFLKSVSRRNLKHEYYQAKWDQVLNCLDGFYKKILIIRPDLLSDTQLEALRLRTGHFIAYYWDTVEIVPRKQEITRYFDRVFSFDPSDCKKYGFEFQTNFYYYENEPCETRYQTYNLSTLDERTDTIEEVAMAMEKAGISYLFKGFREKPFTSAFIQYTPRLSYHQMMDETKYCDVLLDVTKTGQRGLTFRPFEALGLNKKLITTNAEIKEYEFFDPENILIVEPGRIKVEKEFFERPFKKIPDRIRERYHIKQWLTNVLA